MKKYFSLLLVAMVAVFAFAGCGEAKDPADKPVADGAKDLVTITVGASPTPHAEILEAVRADLKAQGFELKITEFNDYVLPNKALQAGDLDANYFQHKPYLDDFNVEQGTTLVSVAAIHYEPLGLYAGSKKTLDELTDGDVIAIPNDTTNGARALLLLQSNGLLKLKADAGFKATALDIVENPKNLKFQEMEAAQVPRSLADVAFGVINGNFAQLAGLNAQKDAVIKEEASSDAAQTYANILAVKAGNENSEKTLALVKALQSETVKTFINDKYQGAVVPIF